MNSRATENRMDPSYTQEDVMWPRGARAGFGFAPLVGRLRGEIDAQADLLGNSGALAAGALITAGMGFLYWWLAARYFPPHAVGLASAAISLMNLIGLIGEVGLGTLLVGETLRHPKQAPDLISGALVSAWASSIICGLGYIALADLFPGTLGVFLAGKVDFTVLFVAGCGITGFALVLDAVFAGLLRSAVQMYRHAAFSALKLILLFVLPLIISSARGEISIFSAWITGQFLSILLLAAILAARGQAVWHTPDFRVLRPLLPNVIGHHLLNVATQAPGFVLPILVTLILSPEVNAAFYAAWMMLNTVLLIPASLTTTLFTIGASDPATITSRLKFSFLFCCFFSLVVEIGFVLCSDFVLGLFGSSYESIGGPTLRILGLSVLALTLKYHYVAVQRLRNRMMGASLLLGFAAGIEICFAFLGGRYGGLPGFAWGWVAAIYLEAAFAIPGLLSAAQFRLPKLHPGQ
ncbi:MAG: hypothetical protein JO172_13300 [Hyphomicrobiales bacterium]|nr:hypothetical protein [Hyphomicrobiales bacterium]